MPRMAQWLKVRNAEGAEASFSAPGSKASTLPQREDPRIWYSFAVECASEGDFLPLRRRAIVSPKDCGWQIGTPDATTRRYRGQSFVSRRRSANISHPV